MLFCDQNDFDLGVTYRKSRETIGYTRIFLLQTIENLKETSLSINISKAIVSTLFHIFFRVVHANDSYIIVVDLIPTCWESEFFVSSSFFRHKFYENKSCACVCMIFIGVYQSIGGQQHFSFPSYFSMNSSWRFCVLCAGKMLVFFLSYVIFG